MEQDPRHQCLVYKGSPAQHLPGLAALIRRKLNNRHRCLYLDSPPMVAGMRSYLAAAGVDVAGEIGNESLVLSSAQAHLVNGHFDTAGLIQTLEEAVQQSLSDGYEGLWASGDMTWELGSAKEMSKLPEYERKLEELFHRQPRLSGVCQYHSDTLPMTAVRDGLRTHKSIYVSETLSRLNPHYVARDACSDEAQSPELEALLQQFTGEDRE